MRRRVTRGPLRHRGCPTGKWVYDAEKSALKSLRLQRESGVMKDGYPYRCEQCTGWHLTSQKKLRAR